MEVIVTIVSKLVDFALLRDVSNLLICRGYYYPVTKYQQDIPVHPRKLTAGILKLVVCL